MVLMLDGNLEISGQVRNNLCYLRHSIRSRAGTNWIFSSPNRSTCLHACAIFSELPYNKLYHVDPAGPDPNLKKLRIDPGSIQ